MPIVTHRTKREAKTNDTTIVFGARGASNPSATTSVFIDLGKPLPDTEKTRQRLTTLVEQGQAYVSADQGIVSVTAGYKVVNVETSSDPFVVAPLVDKVLRSGEEDTRLRGGQPRKPDLEVTRVKERVTVKSGDDLAWLADIQPTLRTIRDSAELVSIWGYVSDASPQLSIRLSAAATDEVVKELQELKPPAEVAINVQQETSTASQPAAP